MEKVRFLSLMRDSVFKTLWLRQDKYVLEFFRRIIKYITNIDINDYELSSNELANYNYESIFNRVDILLYSKDKKRTLNIELNDKYSVTLINKNNSYVLKLAGNTYAGISKDEIYKEDIHTIQINFNNFKDKENPGIMTLNSCMYDKEHDRVRMDLQIYDIYLPVFKEICYNSDEDIYKDLAMFTCTSYEEMEALANGNQEREAIMNDLKEYGKDKKYLDYYDHEEFEEAMQLEAKEIGLAEGRAEGLAEGILQKTKEAAISLYNNNVSKDKIIESLKITEEQFNEYLKEG